MSKTKCLGHGRNTHCLRSIWNFLDCWIAVAVFLIVCSILLLQSQDKLRGWCLQLWVYTAWITRWAYSNRERRSISAKWNGIAKSLIFMNFQFYGTLLYMRECACALKGWNCFACHFQHSAEWLVLICHSISQFLSLKNVLRLYALSETYIWWLLAWKWLFPFHSS